MVPLARLTVRSLHDTLASFPSEAKVNGVTESFLLGMAILKYYFGEEWINRCVTPDTAKDNFLKIDEGDPVRRDVTAFRMIDLAEVIFNLQSVPGFDECIARMRRGDIEGTYAELDFGRMLFLNTVPFRYVVPQGVKGLDYDVEVTYSNGVTACADAKCKIENTAFGKKTIKNTLDHARRQLPKDRPGIVFVKIPQEWMESGSLVATTTEVARDFLRGTRRIVSVKFYVAPISLENGFMKHQHAYKEISNPDSDFGANENWDLFKKMNLPPEWNGMPPHWQRVLFFPDGKVR
jgi:hypothetical protein